MIDFFNKKAFAFVLHSAKKYDIIKYVFLNEGGDGYAQSSKPNNQAIIGFYQKRSYGISGGAKLGGAAAKKRL